MLGKHESEKVMEVQFRWGSLDEKIPCLRLEGAVISLSNVCVLSEGRRKQAYLEYRLEMKGKKRQSMRTYAREVLDLRKHKLYLRRKMKFKRESIACSWRGRKLLYQAHDFSSLKDHEESPGCFKSGNYVLRLHCLFVKTTSNSASLFFF